MHVYSIMQPLTGCHCSSPCVSHSRRQTETQQRSRLTARRYKHLLAVWPSSRGTRELKTKSKILLTILILFTVDAVSLIFSLVTKCYSFPSTCVFSPLLLRKSQIDPSTMYIMSCLVLHSGLMRLLSVENAITPWFSPCCSCRNNTVSLKWNVHFYSIGAAVEILKLNMTIDVWMDFANRGKTHNKKSLPDRVTRRPKTFGAVPNYEQLSRILKPVLFVVESWLNPSFVYLIKH